MRRRANWPGVNCSAQSSMACSVRPAAAAAEAAGGEDQEQGAVGRGRGAAAAVHRGLLGIAGGGIYVNGWAHKLEIANNRIYGNAGALHGGVRVGVPYLEIPGYPGQVETPAGTLGGSPNLLGGAIHGFGYDIGGKIHQHDFIRAFKHPIWHGLTHNDACDAPDQIV